MVVGSGIICIGIRYSPKQDIVITPPVLVGVKPYQHRSDKQASC